MVVGVGIDIIEVSRVKTAIEKWGERFLRRIYTVNERKYCENLERPFKSFAGRFAVKEACMKALGTGWTDGVKWTSFEIINEQNGKPRLLTDATIQHLLGNKQILVSMSQTDEYAAALAILSEMTRAETE